MIGAARQGAGRLTAGRLGALRGLATTAKTGDPTVVAVKEPHLLVRLFPGRTPISKAAIASATVAGFSAAMHSGLYIPSEETVMVVSFVLVVRSLQVLVGGKLAAWSQAQYTRFYSSLAAMRTQAERDVSSALERLRAYSDAADVASAVFGLRRGIVEMEARLAAAEARNLGIAEVRRVLEDAARAAQERRRSAARERAEALLRGVMERLADPEVQRRVLRDAISALSKAQPAVRH